MKYVLAVGSSKIHDVIVTFIGQNTRKWMENGSRPIGRRYVNNLRRGGDGKRRNLTRGACTATTYLGSMIDGRLCFVGLRAAPKKSSLDCY